MMDLQVDQGKEVTVELQEKEDQEEPQVFVVRQVYLVKVDKEETLVNLALME